jgi:hypothetical protein
MFDVDPAPPEPPKPPAPEPLFTHPCGKYRDAFAALVAVFRLLRDDDPRRLIIDGQGQGGRLDSFKSYEIRYCGGVLDVPFATIDLPAVLAAARQPLTDVVADHDGKIAFTTADPAERAAFLDALYRVHFKLKPFAESRDYSIGVELDIE